MTLRKKYYSGFQVKDVLDEFIEDGYEMMEILNKFGSLEQDDVKEVVHAHWIPSYSFEDGFWVCSHCRAPSEASAANVLYKYCPFCGAMMDAEVKDNG